jgi:hypothetical protein
MVDGDPVLRDALVQVRRDRDPATAVQRHLVPMSP